MDYEEAKKLGVGNMVTDVQTGAWCEIDRVTMILDEEIHVMIRHPRHGIVHRLHSELEG